MVKCAEPELDRVFGALADPTRRDLIASLSRGERSVTELAEPLDMSMPAVMKHLTVLERAGLMEGRKTGRVRICSFRSEPLREADAWLAQYERFWSSTLDSLSGYLEKREQTE
jgi:DNA-binding transcriptional ArsR family regulator